MQGDLNELARQLTDCLRTLGTRVVLAESCTAGLVSAALGQIPGVSEFHCGSAVVYRLDTKTRWLDVPAELLKNPGPVSDAVARAMATGVLRDTPEATWSAAITGHLGPQAPPDQDGLVFIAVARRTAEDRDVSVVSVARHELGNPTPIGMSPADALRSRRQVCAAELVLKTLRQSLQLT